MNELENIGLLTVSIGCCVLLSVFFGACLWVAFSNMEKDEGFWFWSWAVSVAFYGVTLVFIRSVA